MKEPITIGQRIVAAVIAHQLGISSDRVLKLYELPGSQRDDLGNPGALRAVQERREQLAAGRARARCSSDLLSVLRGSRHRHDFG